MARVLTVEECVAGDIADKSRAVDSSSSTTDCRNCETSAVLRTVRGTDSRMTNIVVVVDRSSLDMAEGYYKRKWLQHSVLYLPGCTVNAS